MTCQDRLCSDFCSALNRELQALKCDLRVASGDPPREQMIVLLAADGHPLGWLPDSAEAPVIAAFGQMLAAVVPGSSVTRRR